MQFGYGIQEPQQNAGNMYTQGNFSLASLSQITGNVAANGSVSLDGTAKVTGNVMYGTNITYTSSANRSSISGSLNQAANFVPSVALPTPTAFSAGSADITTGGDLILAPGSYHNLNLNGLYQNLTLSSGIYCLNSINVPYQQRDSPRLIEWSDPGLRAGQCDVLLLCGTSTSMGSKFPTR